MAEIKRPNDTLNYELLYFISIGKLKEKQNLYKPDDLEIDLNNLIDEGLITTDCNFVGTKITDMGIKALDDVMTTLSDSSEGIADVS